MHCHQNLIRNRLYQANQELTCFGTSEVDKMTEITDMLGIKEQNFKY